MGFDEFSNTGLLLGLGFTLPSKPKQPLPAEPSLSLGLSYPQPAPHSPLSSLSGANLKRERQLSGGHLSDEDEDGASNSRKKLRLTKQQSALLEHTFKLHTTLNPKQKQALATHLNLRPRQVEVWFQNRRARTKVKQTEVDCEFLKRRCETLRDENRRLQKEVHELKALKLAQPLFMKMPAPAPALTMCPSCHAKSNAPFSMPPNPLFYSPFTHPSAAC